MEKARPQEKIDREIWDADLDANGFSLKNELVQRDVIEDTLRKAYEHTKDVEQFFRQEVIRDIQDIRRGLKKVVDIASPDADELTRMRARKEDAARAYVIGFTLYCAEAACRLLAEDERVSLRAREYLRIHTRPLEQKTAFGQPEMILAANGPVDCASYILDIGFRLELSQHQGEKRAELREKVGGPFASPPLPEIEDALETTKFLRALQKRVYAFIEEDLKK